MLVEKHFRFSKYLALAASLSVLAVLLVATRPAAAITQIPTPDPIPGSYGLAATKPKAPPTVGATVALPGSGTSFTNSPITVSGICPDGLLVQVYDNGVMAGAVMCTNGSFSVQVSLFAGSNELSAKVFDELDQTGPDSNIMTVNYSNTHFTSFGQLITLTSSYGRRSAPVDSELAWPLQLSGGIGPYAFSISWGDGSQAELKSQSLSGVVTIAHTYKKAGIYPANVQVTDSNGVSAFIQLIAVSSGQVDSTAANGTNSNANAQAKAQPQVLWLPTILMLVLMLPTFWLGRRSQVVSLRKQMLKERDAYAKEAAAAASGKSDTKSP